MSNNLSIQEIVRNRHAVKGRQYLMLYDTDFNTQLLIRQRFYFVPGNPDVFTPIPPVIEERLRPLNPKLGVPTTLPFEPRECTACFDNPQVQQGFSEYKVFIPFRPTDYKLKQSIKEIIQLPNVSRVKYSGETHVRGTKKIV
jgi:hypothetical protein